MFTATRLQIATYLLAVCPFSIAFLVFLNASVSFVITDLIGATQGVGDAVGTLGFADELLALVACPLWGLLSDRIGVRYVCVMGYCVVAVALVLFVQARNVYPQLLLGRLLFSVGGAAASTMVTAILPTMSFVPPAGPVAQSGLSATGEPMGRSYGRAAADASSSIIADAEVTAEQAHATHTPPALPLSEGGGQTARATSRIAGYVGMFTGCGALLALALFLPLPARFQKGGIRPDHALQYSYYIVAGIAFGLAIICFFGLMNLQGDVVAPETGADDEIKSQTNSGRLWGRVSSLWRPLAHAFLAGFQHSEIGLGYLGGFVARASSVAISLFVPLLVNAAFLDSGLCSVEASTLLAPASGGLPDIQRRCPRAYVVAAMLTGVSQLVALICAPIFGYAASRSPIQNLPLMIACAAGIVGYPLFAVKFDPDDGDRAARAVAFVAVCLIGISQIGAIVCSLGTLSHGVLEASIDDRKPSAPPASSRLDDDDDDDAEVAAASDEASQLLPSNNAPRSPGLSALKGSVAGVYSFYGGAAILILTKLGGSLFDGVSTGAPFYIMTVFNACLLAACLAANLRRRWAARVTSAAAE